MSSTSSSSASVTGVPATLDVPTREYMVGTPERQGSTEDLMNGVELWEYAGRGESYVEFLDGGDQSSELIPGGGDGNGGGGGDGDGGDGGSRDGDGDGGEAGTSDGGHGGHGGGAGGGGMLAGLLCCSKQRRRPKKTKKAHHLLSEWPATAICGNDITSSCLYVSGERQRSVQTFVFCVFL